MPKVRLIRRRSRDGKKGEGGPINAGVVILLGAFVLLLAINVPVAFSMALACIATLLWQGTIPVSTVTLKLYSGIDTFPFLAIPLFILAGGLMEHGGISFRLVRFAKNLVGHIKGGLGFVVVVSEIFFSGISGSSIADASAIGALLLPSMVKAGYTPPRASAIVAAATGMGMMIPPCLNMVVLGAMTNISIAWLFMGGFLPGFLMALTLMVIIYFQSSRGTLPGAEGKRAAFKEIVISFKDSVIPLMMPVIIFGGIFSGIFTATEAASVATVYAFIVSVFVYKEIKGRQLFRIFVDTAVMTGVTCLLVGATPNLFMDLGNAPGSSGHWTIHRVGLRGTDCLSSHDPGCFPLFWNDPRRSASHSHLLPDPLPDRSNLGHSPIALWRPRDRHRGNIDCCSAHRAVSCDYLQHCQDQAHRHDPAPDSLHLNLDC
jgi:hypothetical protein